MGRMGRMVVMVVVGVVGLRTVLEQVFKFVVVMGVAVIGAGCGHRGISQHHRKDGRSNQQFAYQRLRLHCLSSCFEKVR